MFIALHKQDELPDTTQPRTRVNYGVPESFLDKSEGPKGDTPPTLGTSVYINIINFNLLSLLKLN